MQRSLSLIVILVILLLSIESCEKKTITYDKIDILSLPSLTARNFTTTYTDSGKLQLVLSAPLMESYDKEEEPYSEFREGLDVKFYDGHKEPVASVTAKYARYTTSKSLWELRDSVVAINEAGEKLETEILFWDQKKALIYTDRFVKIVKIFRINECYSQFVQKKRVRNRCHDPDAPLQFLN